MHGEAGVHCGVEYGNLKIWVRWITVEEKCSSCWACSCTVESGVMSDPRCSMQSSRCELHDTLWVWWGDASWTGIFVGHLIPFERYGRETNSSSCVPCVRGFCVGGEIPIRII
jgi:hypothetical protein